MKKAFAFLFALSLLLPIISAVDLEVEKVSSNEVMIVEMDKPVAFDIKVTNLGANDSFEFYNLVGFKTFPVGRVQINAFETKDIKLELSPIGEFDYLGYYTLTYYIRGQDDSEIEQTLTFKRMHLRDVFDIGAGDFDPESNVVQIYLENNENFQFAGVKAKFSSAFFNVEKTFDIAPYERKTIEIELNREDFKQLTAGFYNLEVEAQIGDEKLDLETTLRFAEKNIVTKTEVDYGLIVSTKIIKKINEGNVVSTSDTTIKKNIISRLFTTFSPEPDNVERKGFLVYYTWTREINPGETEEIHVKTNWLFPFLIILLVVAVVIIAKVYSKGTIEMSKTVAFVKAKGGEFALKVSLVVNVRHHIENVSIVDKLPPLVKLYEKFGTERPSKVDEKSRRIQWDFSVLEPGDTRVMSYVIYSKVGVMGKFALPAATAIYEKNGEVHEAESNRAFFVTEQKTKEMAEEERAG